VTAAAPSVQRPTARYVDHVMGMPISLALRGRHASDDAGRAAWTDAMARLRIVDEVLGTYRPDSAIPPPRGGGAGARRGRGDLR
jgi:thiamine biosynthesis lipoprotein